MSAMEGAVAEEMPPVADAEKSIPPVAAVEESMPPVAETEPPAPEAGAPAEIDQLEAWREAERVRRPSVPNFFQNVPDLAFDLVTASGREFPRTRVRSVPRRAETDARTPRFPEPRADRFLSHVREAPLQIVNTLSIFFKKTRVRLRRQKRAARFGIPMAEAPRFEAPASAPKEAVEEMGDAEDAEADADGDMDMEAPEGKRRNKRRAPQREKVSLSWRVQSVVFPNTLTRSVVNCEKPADARCRRWRCPRAWRGRCTRSRCLPSSAPPPRRFIEKEQPRDNERFLCTPTRAGKVW